MPARMCLGNNLALTSTCAERVAGDGLREACAQHVLGHLRQLRESGTLARLAAAHRAELQACLTAALRRRLLAAKPLPLRGSQLLAAAASAATQSANGNDSPYSPASSRCPGAPALPTCAYLLVLALYLRGMDHHTGVSVSVLS